MKIGILALQGAFREHRRAFRRLGVENIEVRIPEQLGGLSGLVIPGGESSAITKLMATYGLDRAIVDFHRDGGAVWGTCAGAITVASELPGHAVQARLGLLTVALERNAYGRQINSFEAALKITGFEGSFPGVFIRAPKIVSIGEQVEVLGWLEGDAVLVRSGRVLASVFHPELSGDDRIHALFANDICQVRFTT
jgi:5'-phosphate synthase pdxT subunit